MRSLRHLIPVLAIASVLPTGCGSVTAAAPAVHPILPADFSLFSTQDGYSALSVGVIDARRRIQDYSDVSGADRVLFTLTSATALSTSRTSTQTLSGSTTFTNLFTNLRPATDYYLTASLYANADASGGFSQGIVRGQGVSNVLSLTSGNSTTVSIKINSVGNISFTTSANSNVISDYVAIEGDTITVDTGVTSTNSPKALRVELVYKQGTSGSTRGSTVSTTTINTSSTTLSWPVPTISGTSESGTLYITIYDAASGGNQIAQKTRTVTIQKGASITPTTLN